MDLSVIILNYQTKDLTLKALKSVYKAQTPPGDMEVILVDNASQDETVTQAKSQFPRLKIIEAQRNLGFAAGNNLGLRKAKGDFFLILNSDTLIQPDTLTKMVRFMKKHPKVGLATCRVELVDNSLDPACHRGFPTPWASLTYLTKLAKIFPKSKLFNQYHQGWKNLNKTHQIDSPSGAFFFLRKKTIQQVGLFDESYFMYGEDLDLAYRIKKANWQVVYTPITKITHLKGASGKNHFKDNKIDSEAKKKRLKTTQSFYDTMIIFYQKHYQKKYFILTRWLVILMVKLIKNLKLIQIRLS